MIEREVVQHRAPVAEAVVQEQALGGVARQRDRARMARAGKGDKIKYLRRRVIVDDAPDTDILSADDAVVADLLQRADRDDVIKLQLLYENSIYGLSNFRSTNGYEKRREAAMAQFVNRGFKAAVEASAIAFVGTKLKSGDSTDGAIFFPNHAKDKSLGTGRLVAHTCGQTFYFETYAELKKH